METSDNATEHPGNSLADSLELLRQAGQQGDVTLGQMFRTFEGKGFGILLVLLSLPSALPVPAPGYSTPFGIALLLLGLQMLMGRPSPWLPQRLNNIRLGRTMLQRMASAGSKFFRAIEHLIRPRPPLLHSRTGQRFAAVLIILMSLLMCLPIPLTNTLPAMVIFLIGVALCEEDGLFGLGAALVGCLALILYTFIVGTAIYLFIEYGWDGLQDLKEVVKQRLGF